MPTRIATNWGSLFFAGDGGEPIEIKDVVCDLEEPDEAPEDGVYVGLDFGSSCTYTFEVQLTRKEYKNILRLVKHGNNWRRMHGKKLIRVPLKERRIKNA